MSIILAVVFVVSMVPCVHDPCYYCSAETRNGLVGYGVDLSPMMLRARFLFLVVCCHCC